MITGSFEIMKLQGNLLRVLGESGKGGNCLLSLATQTHLSNSWESVAGLSQV